eukprot:gnl/Dysnectes_brevis/1897_a2179_1772.p1 GENE.gnl/Dysnectes_brevis/1897_a2179_1772~~gnl/Dysnectes_brevis/1897_a2179_1772.p1  ORF type:complete len:583 (+),score=183.49 gnl/Dysnectes_brevis/1897_a2179_1772:74-1822(+)
MASKKETLKQQAESLKEQANGHFRAGDVPSAIKCYTEAIKLSPSAVYYSNRALAYLKTDNYSAALSDGLKSKMVDPSYIKGRLRLIQAQLALGKLKEALNEANDAYRLDSSNVKVTDLRSEITSIITRLAGAAEHVEPIQTQMVKAFFDLAQVYITHPHPVVTTATRAKDPEAEEELYTALSPIAEHAQEMVPMVQELANELDEFASVILEAQALCVADPEMSHRAAMAKLLQHAMSDLWTSLGDAGAELPEREKAGDLTSILKLCSKGHPLQLWAAALTRLAQGKADQARPLLRRLLTLHPDFRPGQVCLQRIRRFEEIKGRGSAAYKEQRWASAIENFQMASNTLFPQEAAQGASDAPNIMILVSRVLVATAVSNMGMCHAKAGRTPEALAWIAGATCLAPGYGKAYSRAAQLCFDSQMYDESVALLAKASQNDAPNQALQARASKAAAKAGRRDYYAVLGVGKGIDVDSNIYKKAYRRACMKWHPDKNRHRKILAEKQFQIIQEANQVLSDPKMRHIYDQGGNPLSSGGGGMGGMGGMGGFPGGFQVQFGSGMGGMGGMGGIDMSQIFSQMFAGGGHFN